MTSKQKLNPMLNMMIRKAAPIAFKEQEYPASFSRTVEIILKERNMFPKELADLLNVQPPEAFSLLEKSGYCLRMTSAQDAAYFSIITTCGQYSLDEINDVLEDKGFLMIGARQK